MPRQLMGTPYRDLPAAEVWLCPVPSQAEVLALPVTVKFAHAARAMGFSKDPAYRSVGNGTWPTEVPLRGRGRARRCNRADLLAYLGIVQSIEPATAVNY